jgi:hypothetical protein
MRADVNGIGNQEGIFKSSPLPIIFGPGKYSFLNGQKFWVKKEEEWHSNYGFFEKEI